MGCVADSTKWGCEYTIDDKTYRFTADEASKPFVIHDEDR